MSLATLAAELQAVRNALAANLETMGVTVPAGATFADLPPLVLLIDSATGPLVSDVVVGGELVTSGGEQVFVFGSS